MDGLDGMGWVGWDLCAGLFYEHRFAMLIKQLLSVILLIEMQKHKNTRMFYMEKKKMLSITFFTVP